MVPGVGSGSFHQGPFEPIVTCLLKHLTWKTALLPYLRFFNAGVTLFTNLSFLPKVATKENASHPIFVPAMHKQTDRALSDSVSDMLLMSTCGEPVRSGSRVLPAYGG